MNEEDKNIHALALCILESEKPATGSVDRCDAIFTDDLPKLTEDWAAGDEPPYPEELTTALVRAYNKTQTRRSSMQLAPYRPLADISNGAYSG